MATNLKWTVIDRETFDIMPGPIVGYALNRASITDNEVSLERMSNNALKLQNSYFFVGAEIDFKILKNTIYPFIVTIGSEYPVIGGKWKLYNTDENIVKEKKGKFYAKIKFDLF